MAKLAFDGRTFHVAGAVPSTRIRKPPTPLDAFEQALPGCGACENEGHARGNRVLDVCDRAGPIDLAERRVNHNELVAGNNARERDRHRLAVLAARRVDCDQCAATNQLPALAGDGDVGIGHGVGPRLDGMFGTGRAAPLSTPRAPPGPLGAPPPFGWADSRGWTRASEGGMPVPGWRRIAMRMKVGAARRRCRSRGSWRVPLYEVRNPE